MPNPTTGWNQIPVWGFYFKGDDITPIAGRVTLTMTQRVTRVDGRVIYPEGATVERTIGATEVDTATRDAVRAAWRAADEAAEGVDFDGAAWDARWNVLLTGAVFASFPASDDPDIVQTGYQVKVKETLNAGGGKEFYVTPLLSHLDSVPPGINLGLVEVPPGSPTVPAPVYAKGLPGGVASLDADGLVPLEQLPAGTGGGGTGADGASAYEVAVTNGFVGTEAEWLASLEGPQGIQGEVGPQGPQGEVGPAGSDATVTGAAVAAAGAVMATGTLTKVHGPITQAAYDALTPAGDTFYVVSG